MTRELFDELRAEFWETAGIKTFSLMTMKYWVDRRPLKGSRQNPNPTIFVGGDPNEEGVRAEASWPKTRYDTASHRQGWLQVWIGHAWLTLIYARWESYYRYEFAKANNVDVSAVVAPVMGDIRHLRNDVVHKRGVASAEETGKCTVLTTLPLGEVITLSARDLWLLLDNLEVEIRRP